VLVLAALVVGLLAAIPAASASAACTNGQITINNYTLAGPNGPTPAPRSAGNDMTGDVRMADVVSVDFTTGPCTDTVSLVSYKAPDGNFGTQANLNGQEVYAYSSGTVNPNTEYIATIRVPNCYFQTDFVRGDPITQFSSTVTYTLQGRLLDSDVGGTQACTAADTSPGALAPPQEAGLG
jgi:hypothetical protein